MKAWDEITKHSAVIQESVNELLQKHAALKTYTDATEWDTDADAVIELMRELQADLNCHRDEQEELLKRLGHERASKKFLQRVFASREQEDDAKESITNAGSGLKSIDGAIEQLEELMDKTPSSKSEQKEITDELRQQKKELAIEKRQVNENLRQIRTAARQKTVNWTGVHGGTIGRVARYKRASIRLEKERALSPHEDQKTFLERRLIQIEKDLSWVLHFVGDGGSTELPPSQAGTELAQVQRCAYCGRRVTGRDVCQGCGAVI